MIQTPASPAVSLFLSYAHEDEAWLNKLRTHLSLLRRQKIISDWYDRQIVPGTDRSKTIDQHLEQASLILLLVSEARTDEARAAYEQAIEFFERKGVVPDAEAMRRRLADLA